MTSVALSQLFLFGGTLHWPQWALLKLLSSSAYSKIPFLDQGLPQGTHSLEACGSVLFFKACFDCGEHWCFDVILPLPHITSNYTINDSVQIQLQITDLFLALNFQIILHIIISIKCGTHNVFTFPWGMSLGITTNRKYALMHVHVVSNISFLSINLWYGWN